MDGNIKALPRQCQNDLPAKAMGATGHNGDPRNPGGYFSHEATPRDIPIT
jgi:hypothetical protein